MKKITLLLLLTPFLLTAQIYVDNNWKNAINPAFQNLDKTKIQLDKLLHHTMEFSNINA